MLRRRILVLMAVFAIVLAACGGDDDTTDTTGEAGGTAGTGGDGDGLTVGVSWNNFNEPRWAAFDKPAIQAVLEAAGAEYISTDAGSSAEQQLTDVENLISQGADALIILAQDGTAILPAVQSAIEQGIPVIAYDRLIENAGRLYLSFDNVGVGRIRPRPSSRSCPRATTPSSRATRRTPTRTSCARAWRRSSRPRSSPGHHRSSARPTPTTGSPRPPRPTWRTASLTTTTTSTRSSPRTTAWPVASSRHSRRRGWPADPGVRPGRRPRRAQPRRAGHPDRVGLEELQRAGHGCR